jgi:hypothetical protein
MFCLGSFTEGSALAQRNPHQQTPCQHTLLYSGRAQSCSGHQQIREKKTAKRACKPETPCILLTRGGHSRAKIYVDKSYGLVNNLFDGCRPANFGVPDADHQNTLL